VPIHQSLANFQTNASQCDSLISNAHRRDAAGNALFQPRDREQITVAAFLNLFIAWEEFIETAICDFMMGEATLSGAIPIRYVNPVDRVHSGQIVLHTLRYFDYANHDNVRRIAKIYFNAGYPFDATLSGINSDLNDLKTIRNSCAHISSTTKVALEGLATRIFGLPKPGISVYSLLLSIDPRIAGNNTTVYASYRDKLLAAADLISSG
jgi:hypothetical protein